MSTLQQNTATLFIVLFLFALAPLGSTQHHLALSLVRKDLWREGCCSAAHGAAPAAESLVPAFCAHSWSNSSIVPHTPFMKLAHASKLKPTGASMSGVARRRERKHSRHATRFALNWHTHHALVQKTANRCLPCAKDSKQVQAQNAIRTTILQYAYPLGSSLPRDPSPARVRAGHTLVGAR